MIHSALYPKIKKNDARYGKNDKENIVSFENISVLRLVMIGVTRKCCSAGWIWRTAG